MKKSEYNYYCKSSAEILFSIDPPTYVVVWAARPQQVQVPIDKQEKYFNYLANQNQVLILYVVSLI